MIEDVPLETAEERAQRIWRNNRLTRKIMQPKMGETKAVKIVGQELIRDNEEKTIARSLVKYVKQVFETKHNDVLTYYAASIRAEKRKLMLEKLRRLERDNGE
jgi:hypothetical protein